MFMMTRDNKKQNNDRGKCFGLPLVSNEGENLACEKAPCEGGKKFGERSVNPAAKRVGVGA